MGKVLLEGPKFRFKSFETIRAESQPLLTPSICREPPPFLSCLSFIEFRLVQPSHKDVSILTVPFRNDQDFFFSGRSPPEKKNLATA